MRKEAESPCLPSKKKKKKVGKCLFHSGKASIDPLCPTLIFSHLQLRFLWCSLEHDACQSPELSSKSPCSESCGSSPRCPAAASCCQLGPEPRHVAARRITPTGPHPDGREQAQDPSPAAKRLGSGGHAYDHQQVSSAKLLATQVGAKSHQCQKP